MWKRYAKVKQNNRKGVIAHISSTFPYMVKGLVLRVLSLGFLGTRAACGSSSQRYIHRRAWLGRYLCGGELCDGPSFAAAMAGSSTPNRPTISPRGLYSGGLNHVNGVATWTVHSLQGVGRLWISVEIPA